MRVSSMVLAWTIATIAQTLAELALPGFHLLEPPSSLLHLTGGQVNPLDVLDLQAALVKAPPCVLCTQCSEQPVTLLEHLSTSRCRRPAHRPGLADCQRHQQIWKHSLAQYLLCRHTAAKRASLPVYELAFDVIVELFQG